MPDQLAVCLDADEANRLLRSLLSSCSVETVNQVTRLFIDGDAPYQASAIFNHAFVLPPRETGGTVDPIVGFQLLDSDEFSAIVCALYAEKFVPPA